MPTSDDELQHNLDYIQFTCRQDSQRWFPDIADDVLHHILGMLGEAGEVANKLKKIQRGDPNPEQLWNELCEELVDVQIYLCNIAELLHFELAEGFWEKREHNERRFGEGRSDQSHLATAVRGQQHGAAGASAFVCERDVQIKIQPEAP